MQVRFPSLELCYSSYLRQPECCSMSLQLGEATELHLAAGDYLYPLGDHRVVLSLLLCLRTSVTYISYGFPLVHAGY